MKKCLFALAAVALVLASCNNNVKKMTGMSINPSSIDKFYIYDTARLGLTIEPEDAEIPKDVNLVWLSTDTNVVQVVSQNGTITAVGEGEALVKAVAGEFTAACKIYANYEALFWNVANIYYFPSTKSAAPLCDSVFNVDGVKCQLYSVTFICPNGNDFSEDFSAGEGYCLFADVAALFPIEGTDEEKASLAAGAERKINIVESKDEWKKTPGAALVGNLDPAKAGPIYQAYLEKVEAGDQSAKPDWATFKAEAMEGVYLADAEFSDEGVSYSYVPSALVKSGYVRVNRDAGKMEYNLIVQWIVSGFWGLAVNYDAESYSELLIYPYELTPSAMVQYDDNHDLGQFLEEEGAPKKAAARKSAKKFLGKPVPFAVNAKVAK
ncbi:MAG: Ig domain-containing protein [Paludibacteraceae bacterium]|nr:Ig domain-containing protein [Paludibacteraceae bacterium]